MFTMLRIFFIKKHKNASIGYTILSPFRLNVPFCDVLHIFNNLPPFQCGKYHVRMRINQFYKNCVL